MESLSDEALAHSLLRAVWGVKDVEICTHLRRHQSVVGGARCI